MLALNLFCLTKMPYWENTQTIQLAIILIDAMVFRPFISPNQVSTCKMNNEYFCVHFYNCKWCAAISDLKGPLTLSTGICLIVKAILQLSSYVITNKFGIAMKLDVFEKGATMKKRLVTEWVLINSSNRVGVDFFAIKLFFF